LSYGKKYIINKKQLLGKGINGKVFKAKNKITNEECAVKILLKRNLNN